ncbi:hypothetical protein J6590_009627 [Homalodisca vitripennis]|nr:hypothetical protein J6590_009627 [Homalodisca vitripennis]
MVTSAKYCHGPSSPGVGRAIGIKEHRELIEPFTSLLHVETAGHYVATLYAVEQYHDDPPESQKRYYGRFNKSKDHHTNKGGFCRRLFALEMAFRICSKGLIESVITISRSLTRRTSPKTRSFKISF